ncbi:hypothetical protein EZJ19_08750 [Parasulfuritortus cantonensis]|uniref:DUF3037 domain-containing protein n=1 Tax=Parasulfuritortus cantonensis TaxID=2528202 RepID=A0A4R1BDA0_9PROT|nr:hypothetical protein [Parasulfuritortus cantonensis]TCJ14958.1 hypothetical protein EZJ19_08750 [Parasulfuritortus cantonensis]
MSNSYFSSNADVSHLRSIATKIPGVAFSGAWSTIEIQPDVFAPQRFTVGVVVQSPGERLHFKLLDDLRKFDCIYHSYFPQKSIREIMAHAEETLRRGVQQKIAIPEIVFDTYCLSLSQPQYTSGDDLELTVERLFREVVIMSPIPNKLKSEFESMDTPHARKIVNDELKRIAHLDFDRIVNENNQGILLEEDGVKHYLDLNLLTARACGSVTSAVYKTPQSVELNLLKSSRDLTTYSRVRKLNDVGLFLLLPSSDSIEPKDYKRIENVIGEYEWKLEQDGFRVVSLPSAAELAREIYDWAKPTIS